MVEVVKAIATNNIDPWKWIFWIYQI